jgi:ABC-type bacteriocin/lantibiotic exporter with double-glycine peptidase domain
MTRRAGPAALSLRDVTFRYPGASGPALRGLSLDISAGSLIGVTGPVGSGKSALTRAILGIYPLESGTVLIDDRPLEELPEGKRTGVIGYLPQNASLFSGPLRDNVALARDGLAPGDDFLMRVMGLAGLDEDVRAFPCGLDTEIGELGIRLSGGQRQRVGLARAIAAAAPGYPGLLVLDDPFSAVDVGTEARIVAALRHAFGPDAPLEQRVTIVVCSHRLAAFRYADAVVVLREGRIEEMGTHAELAASEGLYARIYRAQRVAEMTVMNGALR